MWVVSDSRWDFGVAVGDVGPVGIISVACVEIVAVGIGFAIRIPVVCYVYVFLCCRGWRDGVLWVVSDSRWDFGAAVGNVGAVGVVGVVGVGIVVVDIGFIIKIFNYMYTIYICQIICHSCGRSHRS